MATAPPVDRLHESLEQQLAELELHEPGVRVGDSEALHQFRVATRRSRALLRPCAGVDDLQRELRWLAGMLGPVRDLDVLIEHVRSLVDELGEDRRGGEAIVSGLEKKRENARAELRAALDSERYPNLLNRFRAELARLGDTGEERLTAVAARELRRLRRAYGDLGNDPSDDELHRVRIKAKRTRYAAELAAEGDGKSLARLAKRAKDLQDAIGIHQDAVIAEQEIRSIAAADSQLAVGRIVELEHARKREMRAKLPKLWRRLEKTAGKAS
jgi:CHAD domain-containing protein